MRDGPAAHPRIVDWRGWEAMATYNPPRRDEACRICVTLDGFGDTRDLYDQHTSNFATGCPRFAAMKTTERLELTKKARMCLRCLDPDWVWKPGPRGGTDHPDCPLRKERDRVSHYSFREESCARHLWICPDHRGHPENKKALQQWRDQLQKKGMRFTLFSNLDMFLTPTHHGSMEPGPEYGLADVEEVPVMFGDHHHCESLDVATDHLRKSAGDVEVIAVPEGEPLFLFSAGRGKTRPINIFYDSGCSHVVFKEGVPGGELEARMTRKGPLSINGIGGSVVKVNDEWAALIERTDGKKQVLLGVAVDKVTSTFPFFNLGDAYAELVESDPANVLLKHLQVPEEAGGDVDLLLGTLYNACHPVPVHNLNCGLTIFRLQLASYDGVDAAIGGPHSSFRRLAGQAGNVSALVTHFNEGLTKFRQLGPPSLRGWHIVETSGILDHPLEDRNIIEMQAITNLAHSRSAALYFLDPGEHCEKLEALEKEEDVREGAGCYDSEESEEKKALMKQDHRTDQSKMPTLIRVSVAKKRMRSVSPLKEEFEELGVMMRDKGQSKKLKELRGKLSVPAVPLALRYNDYLSF